MKKILFVFMLASTCYAQNPDCKNFAGTFTAGPLQGQSQSTLGDTIALCFGDTLFFDHDNDFNLSSDPVPGTEPGIVYYFYNCLPKISGNTLDSILKDNCLWPGATKGYWVAAGTVNGNLRLENDGTLQNNPTFNQGFLGKPILTTLAPATIDDFQNLGYESSGPGGAPGPCVNVNTAAARSILWLNKLQQNLVKPQDGDDCHGSFIVSGGFPEWKTGATYKKVDISLVDDPSVKGLVQLPTVQQTNLSKFRYSVPKAGTYRVSIDDVYSCGLQFDIDMNGCNPSNNVTYYFESAYAKKDSTVCIPLKVKNFNIIGTSFTINWDTSLFAYKSVENYHPAIKDFVDNSNFNSVYSSRGVLGAILFNDLSIGEPIKISDDETLFNICFTVKGDSGQCAPLRISSELSLAFAETPEGQPIALTVIPAEYCINVSGLSRVNVFAPLQLSPNPLPAGGTLSLKIPETMLSGQEIDLRIFNAAGALALQKNLPILAQDCDLPLLNLPPGAYSVQVQNAGGAAVGKFFIQ